MKKITYTNGDATQPIGNGKKIIVHICNDKGGWGKGFVLAISNKWKEPEKAYRLWYKEREKNDFALGNVQLVKVVENLYIGNIIGQEGIGFKNNIPPIRYEAVEKALNQISLKAQELNASVHMPRIGCGLAGGKWEEIEAIIIKTLASHNVDVIVYDFG